MAEWSIYVVNLERYHSGEASGAWFSLPVSEEEVRERLELSEGMEYAIHDYELPFEISEYERMEDLNAMYWGYEDSILGTGLEEVIGELVEHYGSLEEVIDVAEDLLIYGVSSMEELAMYLVKEGVYGEIGDSIAPYIDYEAIARDLMINGVYFQGNTVIVECI